MTKFKMTVDFSEEEREMIKFCAAKAGVKPEQWVHDAVLREVPPGSVAEKTKRETTQKVVDTVFEQLSTEESNSPTPFLTSSSALAPLQQQKVEEKQGGALPKFNEHPCQYLERTLHPIYMAEAQGTCRHPKQDGRACLFAPVTARRCDFFKTKVANRAKVG